MKKLIVALFVLFACALANASVHFNVSVGKDFNSPFNETFDSVYFQSTGSSVTIEKVVVKGKTGECELLVNMNKPLLFKWGSRWSMPMWSCKQEDVEFVSIYTKTHIYTYGI